MTRPGSSSLPPRHRLLGFECSLATSDLDRLESLDRRLAPARLQAAFQGTPSVAETVLLRTCHRVELYLWTDPAGPSDSALVDLLGPVECWRRHEDDAAVLHLFRVAAGLESTAVGEREVRDQVRAAAARVLSRSPRPVLRPLLLESVAAADAVAPTVPASRSIAALAAARVLSESPAPFPRVLVVGTGVMGRTVAELLAPYGRVTLVYRTRPPDAEFLRATDSRAAPWESLDAEIALTDGVVTAVKTAGRIIGPSALSGRRRPLAVIDLGMPRNVDPSLRGHPLVRLIDLEGLRALVSATPLTEVETRVGDRARTAALGLARSGFESWVDRYRREAERVRVALLAEAEAALSELTGVERAAVDRLTRRLAARLLEAPTEGLRAIPPGPEGDERRRWAADLLRLVRDRS